MPQPNELLVAAIKDGTVIDHISAGQALAIISILRLTKPQKIVTVGFYLPSKIMGAKDIIKIEGRELTPAETSAVALFAPRASVNIVRNYKITKKFLVTLPESIAELIVCPNPKCITNNEAMTSLFYLLPGKNLRVRCNYCERIFFARRD